MDYAEVFLGMEGNAAVALRMPGAESVPPWSDAGKSHGLQGVGPESGVHRSIASEPAKIILVMLRWPCLLWGCFVCSATTPLITLSARVEGRDSRDRVQRCSLKAPTAASVLLPFGVARATRSRVDECGHVW